MKTPVPLHVHAAACYRALAALAGAGPLTGEQARETAARALTEARAWFGHGGVVTPSSLLADRHLSAVMKGGTSLSADTLRGMAKDWRSIARTLAARSGARLPV